MKIVKNYLYNAFYQIFVIIIPLITTPYLARILGPTGVGINSYTNSVIQYFILFGSIGINLYGNRQIAFVRDDKEKLTKTFYEIFIMRIITVLLAYFAFMIFFLNTGQYHRYYLAQSISLIAVAFDISWFFMGVENFAITVLRNLIIKIITLISIFIFVKSYADLFTYILILSFSTLVGNIVLFPELHKYLTKIEFQSLRIFRHLRPSIMLFIPQIATQVYLVLNKTLLGIIISVQATAFFEQSDRIVKVSLAVVTATGTVMLPHVANIFAQGKMAEAKQYLYKGFNFVTFLSVPMMFGLMAISSKFVPLFFTNKFLPVIFIMRLETIIIIFIAWSNAIGIQYLLPTKHTREFNISVFFGAVVDLLFSFPLIYFYGAVGATIATVFAEFSVTVYQFWVVRNEIEYKKLFTDVGKYFTAGIIMFLIVYVLDKYTPASWLMIILEIFVGMLSYLLILILSRASILSYLKHQILNR